MFSAPRRWILALSLLVVLVLSDAPRVCAATALPTPLWTAAKVTPRTGMAAAYVPGGDEAYFYGGYDDSRGMGASDFWMVKLGATPKWTRLVTSGTGPGNRTFASMIYDPLRNRLLLFGGADENQNPYNDVWALPLGGTLTWTQLTPTGGPPDPRSGAFAAYDRAADQMVVFGGDGNSDTWLLKLSSLTWVQLENGTSAPHVASRQPTTLDLRRHRLVTASMQYPANLPYSLDLTSPTPTWTAMTVTGSAPYGLWQTGAVYDSAGDRMIIPGGRSGCCEIDSVFSLTFGAPNHWLNISGSPRPGARYGQVVLWDTPRARVLVAAGRGCQFYRDIWEMPTTGSPNWVLIPAAEGTPASRFGHVAMVDAKRSRMLLFGGGDCDTTLHDTWSLSLGDVPAWSPFPTAGSPPARSFGGVAVLDSLRDRIVFFGGSESDTATDRIFQLSLAGTPTWSELLPPLPHPAARHHHTGVLDSRRNRMVIFGGLDRTTYTYFGDVWAFDLVTDHWSQLAPAGTLPGNRYGHAAAFDPTRNRMLMLGGNELSDPYPNAMYGLDFTSNFNGTWSVLDSGFAAGPNDRVGARLAIDRTQNQAFLFGGMNAYGGINDNLYSFDLGLNQWDAFANPPFNTAPSGRAWYSAVWDQVHDRYILSHGEEDVPSPSAARERGAASAQGAFYIPSEGGNFVGDTKYFGYVAAATAVTPRVSALRLGQPAPTPSRGAVTLRLELPAAGRVTCAVFNASGRRVRPVLDQVLGAGEHNVGWDGRDEAGRSVASGIYFYRIGTESGQVTRRVLILR